MATGRISADTPRAGGVAGERTAAGVGVKKTGGRKVAGASLPARTPAVARTPARTTARTPAREPRTARGAKTIARTRALPYDAAEAVAALAAADPVLGRLMARVGPLTLRLPAVQSPFEALVRSILYQQLHGKAAAAIHGRMIESFAEVCGVGVHPGAGDLLECPTEQLRGAGLSHNKVLALRDLAAKTIDGTVPTLAAIRRMADDEVVERLTAVRGIGRWTVEMLLIFRLGRPDVLPVDDYGVRKGFALTFQKLKPGTKVTPALLPRAEVMEKRARRWAGWRSVASWYLWRACDLAAEAAKQ